MDESRTKYLLDVVTELRTIASEVLDPWEKVIRLCGRVEAGKDVRHRAVIWLDLLGQAAREPKAREWAMAVHKAWVDLLVEVIDEGVSRGVFDPKNGSGVVALQLVTYVDGLDVAAASGASTGDSGWRNEQLIALARILLGVPGRI